MSEKKKGGKEFDNPYSVAKAVTKGNALTKLSMVVLGLGNIAHHQIISDYFLTYLWTWME